jgi:hypothetical protein
MVAANENFQISATRDEFIKQYLVYDASGRYVAIYEIKANGQDGEKCMLTEYAYDGASTRIVYRRESSALWNGTWDALIP